MIFLTILDQIDKYLTEPDETEEIPCYYDGVLKTGATYRYGNFIYKYKQEKRENDWINIHDNVEGWGVALDNELSKKPITVEGYCNTIRGFPIVSMAYMFEGSYAESIDMSYMFSRTLTKSLDLSSFDTSNVKFMEDMLDIRYGRGYIYVKNEEEYERLKNSPGRSSDAIISIKG